MRLRVLIQSSHSGFTSYIIQPHRYKPRGCEFYPEDVARLRKLKGRIAAMAKHRLGKAFRELNEWSPGYLELRVKKGTSRHPDRKFDFSELAGWICSFDDEPKKAGA